MATRDVVVQPLLEIWILEWVFPNGRKRAQHPHIHVAAGGELRYRAAADWAPTAAIVEVVGQTGKRMLPVSG